MHVVQLLPELNQGGVERGTVELNRELVKRGHTSSVISFGGKQVSSIVQDGGNHYTLDVCSKNPLNFFARASKLSALLQSIDPDILHARSRVPAWLTWHANKQLHLPFITTVHGFNSVNPYSAIMTKGDLVIYSSESVKNYITEKYNIDSKKLRYVPRGIDMKHFREEAVDQLWINQFKTKYTLHNRQIITTVGRITPWKGQDDFIRAIGQAQQSNPALIGLIVGGVWHGKETYLDELKTLAASCDAEVIFAGSHSQVREIYALSDLVISPASTKPETFGRVAAEALAMNTPVIASNHGGSCDIVLPKVNGLLYTPTDFNEMADAILESEHITFYNMREHIDKNFSIDAMYTCEMDTYRAVLEDWE